MKLPGLVMLLNLTNLFSMVKVAPIKVAPDFTAVSKQGTIDNLCDHIKPSIEFFIEHGDGIKHQFQKNYNNKKPTKLLFEQHKNSGFKEVNMSPTKQFIKEMIKGCVSFVSKPGETMCKAVANLENYLKESGWINEGQRFFHIGRIEVQDSTPLTPISLKDIFESIEDVSTYCDRNWVLISGEISM